MKAFEYDSGFMKFAILLSRLTLLNLIWLIACIPVVTIGASTAAMHYSAAKLMNGAKQTLSSTSGFIRES